MHRWLPIRLVLFLTCLLLAPHPTHGQRVDSYEGLDVSWELADHDCASRVVQHERSFQDAHSGQTSEYFKIHAGTGTYVHLITPVRQSRIIDELTVSIWVKANQPGLRLSARAVLPRSSDPRTGESLTTLLRGTIYQEPGKWEKLTVELPAEQLARQIPILRSQFGSDVTSREAHIDMLVLNAYGGPGNTQLWLDDLEITGQVPVGSLSKGEQESETESRPSELALNDDSQAAPELQGSVLTFDDRPQLVRAIDANGEPFAWLKSLGFNAVRLSTPPTAEQLRAARECKVWLIVPPPKNQSVLEYGTGLKQILAWDLGEDLATDQVDATRRQAQQLRSMPDEDKRAIICMPREKTWQYSRLADLLVLKPPGPNNTLPLERFGEWYLRQSRLASMGSHFWASIPTQLGQRVTEQLAVMGHSRDGPPILEPDQIRLMAYHAIASGARGLLFRSRSRLDSSDRLTEIRANTLERLNQELAIVEPWATTGAHEHELETSDPSARASVLKTERSRLLLVIRRAADQQYVAGPVGEKPVSFEVPGTAATDEVYRVSKNGLKRITPRRATGVHITLDKRRLITPIVLTQDQLVINYLAKQAAALREIQQENPGEIAASMYATVVDTHQGILEAASASQLSDQLVQNESLELARRQLQHFQKLVESGGHEQATDVLRRGKQELARARAHDWKLATSSFPSPVSSPLCVSFFSLPLHYELGNRLRNVSWEPNSLTGGDFENLSLLQSSGWKNVATDDPSLQTAVELSLHSPRSGRSALRLQCWPAEGEQAPLVVDSPPLKITTAPVAVQKGQLIYVHGWARVESPIQGSMDGLLISDSITDLDLAQRIHASNGWQEFSFYRTAPRDGTFTATVALSGMGEAWLDDVTLHLSQTSISE
ncbi:MAG: hypothetical protein ACOC7K_01620 [bacterium]